MAPYQACVGTAGEAGTRFEILATEAAITGKVKKLMPTATKRKPWTPARVAQLRRALKARHGWTQAEIAEKVGVTARHWRNWETGHTSIRGTVLFALDSLSENLRN